MSTTAGQIVCLECGARNRPGEDFCGECGAYLAWEGDAATSGGTPSEATDAAPRADSAAEAGSPEARPSATEPVDPAAPAGAPAATPTESTPAVVPVKPLWTWDTADPPTAEPEGLAMRKPTAPAAPHRRPAPAPLPAEPPPGPGDVRCPACGAGNRPERRFCRRCAAPLAAPRAADTSAQPAAGSRPKGRSTRFPFTAVIVLAVLLGLIVVAWLNRDVVIGFVETIVGYVFSSQSG
ncbi:hypothetical protein [Microbacterium sp. SS28]|uniref:hypothetical protein n=1 Tax=Microbacterium sp. SS28 TaxID=2919948 RepID=UPI001FAB1E39|nr:hypothetical protein [Microbacterium sp. SS28]